MIAILGGIVRQARWEEEIVELNYFLYKCNAPLPACPAGRERGREGDMQNLWELHMEHCAIPALPPLPQL